MDADNLADNRPGLPLSLQDMCMLCIMLRLEEFPTDSLALLPSAIRRRLFLGLAHADLLHVDTEVLFGDLHYSGLDPSREDHRQRGPAVAREELLDVIFHGSTPSFFFSLNLEDFLDCCYQCVKCPTTRGEREFYLIDHICKCYPSLEPTMVPLDLNVFLKPVVLPKRFLQFVILHWNHNPYSQSKICELQVPFELAQPLLMYCKMQYAPKHLDIDCCSFDKSIFWKKIVEDRYHLLVEKMDPVIPFLQDFLSSVEVLELIRASSRTTVHVILYNIVTSSQPHLKHLKIHGIPHGFRYIFQLFLKARSNLSVYTPCTPVPFPFAFSLPDPYPLEGLSVHSNIAIHDASGDMIVKLQSLVVFHMRTLKHVTIQGIGFRYAIDSIDAQYFDKDRVDVVSFATLLSSSFTQLLKQPQFRALRVDEYPLSGACALIETFLTTPASHEQTLCVEGLDEQDLMERENGQDEEDNSAISSEDEEEEQEVKIGESDEDTFVVKRRRITKQRKKLPERIASLPCSTWSHNIPETNAQFKCLDLGHSSSCIHSLLFSLPELKLKKLRMRTQDMTLVPAGTAIKVEHVVFSTQTRTSYKPTISPAHLEKFTISNPVLKRLEFEHPTDECAPGLIPALIHCLSKFYQQGRGLDELVLHSITFDHIDIREFFTIMGHLSHQHGTTLVLTPSDISTHHLMCQQSTLFAGFSKETKIKKIICKMEDWHVDPRPQLSPLAEEVVVDYHSCFYTNAGRKCYL